MEDVRERQSGEPRATCYRCFRPRPLCYCEFVEPITPLSQIIVLQHQREIFHPLNTTRMLELAVFGARIERGNLPELEAALARRPLPPDAALLFPSADAEDLLEANARRPISAIVALDGTWDQAKSLLRLSGLEKVRRVRFRPEAPSEYRIRKEPKVDYLSTLESVALVLERLEPGLDVEPLRRLFRRAIDRNIEARPGGLASERRRVRGRGRSYRFPAVFLAPAKVVVYAEAAKVRGPHGIASEPLQLEARRLEDGEVVDARSWTLRTSAPPLDVLLGHLGLTQANVLDGLGVADVRQGFDEFTKDAPVFVWAPSSARILRGIGVERTTQLLKGTYLDFARFREGVAGKSPPFGGGLADALRREGLSSSAPEHSRAKRRIDEALLLTRHLEELAREQR